jgi:hypothetical protein
MNYVKAVFDLVGVFWLAFGFCGAKATTKSQTKQILSYRKDVNNKNLVYTANKA